MYDIYLNEEFFDIEIIKELQDTFGSDGVVIYIELAYKASHNEDLEIMIDDFIIIEMNCIKIFGTYDINIFNDTLEFLIKNSMIKYDEDNGKYYFINNDIIIVE